MTSPTKMFFDDLARQGHVAWLEHEHGRLRFDLEDSECIQRWTVAFNHGDVEVSRGDGDADGVLRADRTLFDRAALGEEDLVAARLRGEIRLEGSLELLVQFSQLLPGPPGQTGPRMVGNAERRPR